MGDGATEGSGITKENVEGQRDNLKQAMQKLELNDKIKGKNGEFADGKQGPTTTEILAASKIDGSDETMEQRQ